MSKKLIGLVLLVVGGVLLYFGFTATESPVEALSQSLTGRYSDETMLYLIGGSALAVIGLVLAVKGR